MPKTTTTIWDPSEHLKTDDDMAEYLDAALEDGDASVISVALGDIARAKGMTQVARDAGLGQETLNESLLDVGKPELATVLRVISALGLQLHASPARKSDA